MTNRRTKLIKCLFLRANLRTKTKNTKFKSKKDVLNPKKKAAAEEKKMAAMDPEERKAEQQRLVEEGDYAMTEELFGVEASGSALKPVNRDEHEALGTILGKNLPLVLDHITLQQR